MKTSPTIGYQNNHTVGSLAAVEPSNEIKQTRWNVTVRVHPEETNTGHSGTKFETPLEGEPTFTNYIAGEVRRQKVSQQELTAD